MAKLKGIDISTWQGKVDFNKVKGAGIQFCILREGFRQTIDSMFIEYVKGCQKSNIPVLGIYHFSYALNKADAEQEAICAVNNLKKAGLGKDVIVFYDFEYDTVKKAKEKGVTLGKKQCTTFTKAFCEKVTSLGYRAGIYSNIDYYKNMYDQDLLHKYVFWLAHYTSGSPAYKCDFQQYSSSGKVNGISGNVDMDWFFGELEEKKVDSDMKYYRQSVVDQCEKWIGLKESDGSHKKIIDIYNNGRPSGAYRMTYYDPWCACAVSAVAIELGYTSIIPVAVGCPDMINKFKALGRWKEADNYVPKIGDVVFYDWQDGKNYKTTNNTGSPDHVGIVYKVSGNTFYVWEGNMGVGVCGIRKMEVNGRYIRGFGLPKYTGTTAPKSEKKEEPKKEEPKKTKTVTASKGAKSFNEKIAGTYRTTDALNLRDGAGTSYKILTTLKKGAKVKNYGYYTTVDKVKWYYVQITVNNTKYTGFCSSKYLKKV